MSAQGRSLVTGGGGFIGTHLVNCLLEQGEEVRVLELDGVSVSSAVEVVRGSITDEHCVRRVCKSVQRIYHLAAYTDLWARDKQIFHQVNHAGTCILLAEAAHIDIEAFVHTSTQSVLIEKTPQTELLDESVKSSFEDMPGAYCQSKFLAEQAAHKASRNGLPVIIVSPTLPIGPGDSHITPPTRMLLNFLNRRVPAYLDCRLNMADVRDIAFGHILAARHGSIGERYILGHENLMLGELLRIVEKITGSKMPGIQIPYWVALLTGIISEFVADYVTHQPPVAPLTGVRLAGKNMHFACSKAKQKLGFNPRPLRESLADEITWLVQQGYVTRPLSLNRP